MSLDPSLHALLQALREAKLLVGVGEALRLETLLSLEPALDRRRLRRLVACVAVRSSAQQEAFDRIFDAWFEQTQATLEGEAADQAGSLRKHENAEQGGPPGTGRGDATRLPMGRDQTSSRTPSRSRRGLLFGAAVVAALAAVVAALAAGATGVSVSRIPPSTLEAPNAGSAEAADSGPTTPNTPRPKYTLVLAPTITILPPVLPLTSTRFASATFALLVGISVSLGLRRRQYVPKPEPSTARAGPLEIPLTPPVIRGPVLLGPNDRDAIVWSIGRSAGDEPTRAINLKRSVRATAAAGGVPALRFRRRSHYHTVWLWIDGATEDPTLARLASELETLLSQSGLPVARATYWAIPDRLRAEDGTTFTPGEIDERQGFDAVVLLTDGRRLSIRGSARDERRRIDALFRSLSHWPKLAIADFGDGLHGLDAIVGPHEIPVIRPEEIASFLAHGVTGQAAGESATVKLEGGALLWAAACALSPRPIDEATALELQRELDINVTPWTLRALHRESSAAGELLGWDRSKRAELLGWLRTADSGSGYGSPNRSGTADGDSEDGDSNVPEASLLGQALQFWRARYEAEDKARVQAERIQRGPWIGTPAERRHRVDATFFDLWDDPNTAAHELYRFRGTELEDIIKHRMQDLIALEHVSPGEAPRAVVMPWHLERRPPEVQEILRHFGFGGPGAMDKRKVLLHPARRWLALGVAVGLATGGAAMTARSIAAPEPPTCRKAPAVSCDVTTDSHRSFAVAASVGAASTEMGDVPPGSYVITKLELSVTGGFDALLKAYDEIRIVVSVVPSPPAAPVATPQPTSTPTAPPPYPPSTIPKTFEGAEIAIDNALKQGATSAQVCRKDEDGKGNVTVSVNFKGGTATSAQVIGDLPKFKGTKLGSCIANTFKAVRAGFDDELSRSRTYSFSIK